MKALLQVSRAIDAVSSLIAQGMYWLTLLMVLLGAYNVVTRYVGRAIGVSLGGSIYTVLQTYFFDLIFLLAAAHVMRTDGHVRVDIIYTRLGERAKAWVDIFGTVLLLGPFCYMGFVLSLPYVRRSWQHLEANVNANGLPIYWIKTAIPVAFALLLIQGVSEIIKRVAFLRGALPPTEPTEAVEAG